MSNFLYLSDVFCPWCYGFGPVMRRVAAEHPTWPVRVLGGGLMDEPSTLADMVEEMPHIREFFVRLADTTGQPVGDSFLSRLEPGQGYIRMYSPAVAVPLAALKTLAPGHALDQIEAFQSAFYGQGRDVLALDTQRELAAAWGVSAADFDRALADPAIQGQAQREMDEAAAIMGEFTLYPTLYLETGDGCRHLLARGFVPYEDVAAKLAAVPAGEDLIPAMGKACRLDGHCD